MEAEKTGKDGGGLSDLRIHGFSSREEPIQGLVVEVHPVTPGVLIQVVAVELPLGSAVFEGLGFSSGQWVGHTYWG